MELLQYLKSMAEEDRCALVLCNLEHRIVYMNPAAQERYKKWGGAALLGRSLLDCHNEESCGKIERVLDWFRESRSHNRVFTYRNEKEHKDVYMVALRDEEGKLIGYYEKHEYRTPESAQPYQF